MSTQLEQAAETATPGGAAALAPPASPAPAVPALAEAAEPAPTAPGLWRATWAIAKKELNIYFTTPLAYVLLAFFIFVMGYFFVSQVQIYLDAMRQAQAILQFNPQAMDQLNFTDVIFSPTIFRAALVFVFILPFVTMRLIAEEKRQNTIQLLMTAPVGSVGIVLGKFLASSLVVLFAVVLTMAYPLLLGAVADGGGVEWQTAAVAYLGVFLCGTTFVSIGLFISSLTDSQIVAGIVTLVVLLLLWLMGMSSASAEGLAKDLAEWASLPNHLQSFARGILKLEDVVYFLSITVLGLFLTRTSIERMRW